MCVLFEKFDDYTDFLRQFEGMQISWAGGYSWKTNRASFFQDRDNPAFKEVHEKVASIEATIKELRERMDNLGDGETAKRLKIQEQLKHNNALLANINARLNYVGRISTLSKTRPLWARISCFSTAGFRKREWISVLVDGRSGDAV